jgi:cobalamin synthase
MRPGSLIAAACLTLLSVLRVTEQAYGLATLFAVLALAALAFGARAPRAATAPAEPPAADTVRAAAAVHERHHRTWRTIALFGLAVSVVGAFTFPPMALVVAGLSAYAVYRMRRSRHSSRLLEGTIA